MTNVPKNMHRLFLFSECSDINIFEIYLHLFIKKSIVDYIKQYMTVKANRRM